MNKQLMPYLLPLLTIFAALVFFIRDPTIVSYLVLDPNDLAVKIETKADLIPEDAIIKVVLDGQEASMTVSEFIYRAGGEFNYTYGYLDSIGYEGYGFIGDYTYTLDLKYFEINDVSKGDYTLKTEVLYNTLILASNEVNVTI